MYVEHLLPTNDPFKGGEDLAQGIICFLPAFSYQNFIYVLFTVIGTQKDYLACHIQLVHEGVKYECNQCEYRTATQMNLICHIQSVHEECNYDCNQFEYRATHKVNLACHIQSLHEGYSLYYLN